MGKSKIYAVLKGRKVGLFDSWPTCQAQVNKFPGAKYKSFNDESSAKSFLKGVSWSDFRSETSSIQKTAASSTKSSSKGPPSLLDSPMEKLKKPSSSTKSSSKGLPSFLDSPMEKLKKPSTLLAPLVSAKPIPKGTVVVYTDGSCLGNKNVKETKPPAGWGVVLLQQLGSDAEEFKLLHECFGPVVTDPKHPDFMHAEVLSNNTGELCAIAHALNVIGGMTDKSVEKMPIRIRFDSEYAAKSIVGLYNGSKNVKLIENCRDILRSTTKQRIVEFEHVRAHVGETYNERVDFLAKKGAAMSSQLKSTSLAQKKRKRDDENDEEVNRKEQKQE